MSLELIKNKLKSKDSFENKLGLLLLDGIEKDMQLQTGILNEEKDLAGLRKYITKEAKKHLKGKSGGIESEIIKGWSIHYFTEEINNETDNDLDIEVDETVKSVSTIKDTKIVEKPKKAPNFEILELDLFGE